jgi:DNA helicase-2/ATP-dependent DNA helicase PcrA
MAVLYRNNVLSRMFEDTFIKAEIPYTIYGGISFYASREIKDALAFIRLALDFNQDFYLKRIINVPKRSIGLVSVQKLEACAKDLNLSMMEAIDHVEISGQTKKSMLEFKHMMEAIRLGFDAMGDLEEIMPFLMGKTGYIDSLRQEKDDIADDRIENLLDLKTVFARGDQYYEGTFIEKLTAQLDQISLYSDLDKEMLDENRVRLSTYHQVKGLEFKVVFMVVLEEGIFPSDRSIASSYELEEERRVAYVGMTRAKERLYLSYADQRMLYGSMRRNIPSRFVMESRLDDGRDHVIQNHTTTIDHILKTGDKVLHQIFGEGVVIRVDDEIATIAFGFPHGIKKILESHPSIRKIRK